MTSLRFVHWICFLALISATHALAGPVKICVEGDVSAPTGAPALDGAYDVTIRLWNGLPSPIISMDSVRIDVVKGKFRIELGPYPALTRETFSTKKSLSFQFQNEPEINPRTPLLRMAASGKIHCTFAHLSTSNLPLTVAGTRVRLGMKGATRSATGTLLSLNGERIELLHPVLPNTVQQFAFDSVERFDVSARFRRHGQAGLLAGIALGAMAGYGMGSGEEDDLSMSKETKRAFDAFAGAIIGGLTGYLIGNSMTTDRWQPLPLDRLRQRVREGENFLATGRN